MKYFISLSFLVFLGLTLISCDSKNDSPLLDQTITKTNLNEIITNIETDNSLEAQDVIYFSNGLGRLNSINVDTLFGISVKNVIDYQKDFLKETNYNVLKTTASRVAMNMNYSIKYLGVRQIVDTVKNVDGTAVLYEINNTSGKTITKLAGLLQFYNSSNQLIKQFELNNPQELGPDANIQFYKAFSYNPEEPRDTLIRFHNTKMIVRWQPQTLEFSDGTKIEMK